MLSKNQVDKIGECLRGDLIDADVLRRLEEYRAEFTDAYTYVEYILTEKLLCEVTGRPTKSTLAIIEKLKRLRSRLSQIQDVAGCRVIVASLGEQNALIALARQWFPEIEIDDKRDDPTHGYRAVHLLITHQGKMVEVQVRTRAQHFWASISEKLADTFGQDIKYGKGDKEVLGFLEALSKLMRRMEHILKQRMDTKWKLEAAYRAADRKERRRLKKLDAALQKEMRLEMYRIKGLFEPIERRQMEEADK